jgi:NADP-dependent 3-hydroxy acid dehydrogenase YdfG
MRALEQQVAVVTGASSGIGRAIALALAGQGARLCLVGRRLETLQSVADAADDSPSRHQCYRADLAVDDEVTGLAARLMHDMRSIDILVHGAGVIWLAPSPPRPTSWTATTAPTCARPMS